MIRRRQRVTEDKVKSIVLGGGLNESQDSLNAKPGELIFCMNYNVAPGDFTGYESTGGFDPFDGRDLPATVSLNQVKWWTQSAVDYDVNDVVYYGSDAADTSTWKRYKCIQAADSGDNAPDITPGSNTWWQYKGFSLYWYEEYNRTDAYSAVIPVPGSGNIRGIHIYNNKVYAWRNDATGAVATACYVSDSTNGWTAFHSASSAGGTIASLNARFSEYQTNAECMYWIDSVDDGFYVYNGATTTNVTSGLPTGTAPINIAYFDNRLILIYPGGHILFSVVGDPTNWDTATNYAGEIYIGEEITDIAVTSDVIYLFTHTKIYTLKYGSSTEQFIFQLDQFTDRGGAFPHSVQVLDNMVIYVSNDGVYRIAPSPQSGALMIECLTNKVKKQMKTFLEDEGAIGLFSIVDPTNKRYYCGYLGEYYSFTFANGRFKGIGKFNSQVDLTYVPFSCSHTGKIGQSNWYTDWIMVGAAIGGSVNGMVYRFDYGYMMGGIDNIYNELLTTFHAYGNMRQMKNFKRYDIELDGDYQTFYIPNIGTYVYYSPQFMVGALGDHFRPPAGIAARPAGNSAPFAFDTGYYDEQVETTYALDSYWNIQWSFPTQGRDMALGIWCETNIDSKHIIHNFTVDYNLGIRIN